MFGLGGSKTIVGLDIGSSSIKLVELKKGRSGITVTTMGMEPLASDIVVDSMIVDSGSVASAITKLFAEHNIKAKAVATSVSGHSVIVKPNVKMPAMSDGELSDVIQQEAAQYIPFDIADVNINFQILNDESMGPQMDVLLGPLSTSTRSRCRTATSTTTSRLRIRRLRC
jgi:type IV pilus assembly protein PilM